MSRRDLVLAVDACEAFRVKLVVQSGEVLAVNDSIAHATHIDLRGVVVSDWHSDWQCLAAGISAGEKLVDVTYSCLNTELPAT